MLTELAIRDLAIIDALTLSLGPGLTVLTGETGAGKSIILGALNLLLGERASTDDLRAGCDEAEVSGRFEVRGGSAAAGFLRREGLDDSDAPGTALVRRVITREGRSRCWVNGRAVPVATLRALGDLLVDLHGQHQHQSLLDAERHRGVLDEFGGLDGECGAVAAAHAAWSETRAARRRLEGDARELERRRDDLLHQIREVESAGLRDGELAGLEAERGRLRHADALITAAAHGVERIQEGDEVNALTLVAQARAEIEKVAAHDARLAALLPRLDETVASLADIAGEMRTVRDGIEADPARLDHVEERIAAIRKILKRHGDTEADVLALLDAWKREAESLDNRDAEIERLTREEERRAGALAQAALALRAARQQAGDRLSKALIRELRELAMERAEFAVRMETVPEADGIDVDGHGRVHVTAEGMDAIEFLLSPNPGEPLKPLAKIASGGELSRIMLALKAVAAGQGGVPTLVFDEIDTGISGQTAGRVAAKMVRLAGSHQILCITHLPQIAARAAAHLGVSKRPKGRRTVTEVTHLDGAARVDALATLIGGESTAAARRHAEEMLEGVK